METNSNLLASIVSRRLLRIVVVAFGVGLVGTLASVAAWKGFRDVKAFDDAYITFRYANLAAGKGIVYNPGERVAGYANFLWVIVSAGLCL